MSSLAPSTFRAWVATLVIALGSAAAPRAFAQALPVETPLPADGIIVTLTGPETVRGAWQTTDRRRLVCRFSLQATATGGLPGATATWEHGRGSVERLDGSRTSQQAISARTLAAYFAGAHLATGRAIASTRLAASDGPFRVVYHVTYSTPGRGLRQASYTVACLPPADEADVSLVR